MYVHVCNSCVGGLNLSVEDQAKLDARNYASLERQYWRMLVAFEELKKSIASMKERMMKVEYDWLFV